MQGCVCKIIDSAVKFKSTTSLKILAIHCNFFNEKSVESAILTLRPFWFVHNESYFRIAIPD